MPRSLLLGTLLVLAIREGTAQLTHPQAQQAIDTIAGTRLEILELESSLSIQLSTLSTQLEEALVILQAYRNSCRLPPSLAHLPPYRTLPRFEGALARPKLK